jgi:hypothetical protein
VSKTGESRTPPYTIETWNTNDCEISATFDENGKVIGKGIQRACGLPWLVGRKMGFPSHKFGFAEAQDTVLVH